jgi:hypothetical protein
VRDPPRPTIGVTAQTVDQPTELGACIGLESSCAEGLEPGNFGVDVGRLDVEVHAVLGLLGFVD